MKLRKRVSLYAAIIRKCWNELTAVGKTAYDQYQYLSRYSRYVPGYKSRSKEEHEIYRRTSMDSPGLCKHLKGGKLWNRKERPGSSDYNVTDHTFIDGSRRIRCNSCGAKWFQGQPGWEEALRMMDVSSNSHTSSEAIMYSVTGDGLEKYYVSAEGIKKDFPEWDGVLPNSKEGKKRKFGVLPGSDKQ